MRISQLAGLLACASGAAAPTPPNGQTWLSAGYMGINVIDNSYFDGTRVFRNVARQAPNFNTPGHSDDYLNQAALGSNNYPVDGSTWDMLCVGATTNPKLNGTYQIRFKGQAVVTGMNGCPNPTLNYSASTGYTTGSLVSASGAGCQLHFTSSVGFSQLEIMAPGYAPGDPEIFTEDYVSHIATTTTQRYMQALGVNDDSSEDWATARAAESTLLPHYKRSLQFCLDLSNRVNGSPWLCIAAKASDAYISTFLSTAAAGSTASVIRIEYVNEPWSPFKHKPWIKDKIALTANVRFGYDANQLYCMQSIAISGTTVTISFVGGVPSGVVVGSTINPQGIGGLSNGPKTVSAIGSSSIVFTDSGASGSSGSFGIDMDSMLICDASNPLVSMPPVGQQTTVGSYAVAARYMAKRLHDAYVIAQGLGIAARFRWMLNAEGWGGGNIGDTLAWVQQQYGSASWITLAMTNYVGVPDWSVINSVDDIFTAMAAEAVTKKLSWQWVFGEAARYGLDCECYEGGNHIPSRPDGDMTRNAYAVSAMLDDRMRAAHEDIWQAWRNAGGKATHLFHAGVSADWTTSVYTDLWNMGEGDLTTISGTPKWTAWQHISAMSTTPAQVAEMNWGRIGILQFWPGSSNIGKTDICPGWIKRYVRGSAGSATLQLYFSDYSGRSTAAVYVDGVLVSSITAAQGPGLPASPTHSIPITCQARGLIEVRLLNHALDDVGWNGINLA